MPRICVLVIFSPVLVFCDGSDYWLADGFHRLAGRQSLELPAIAVDIRQGARRDAILYSVGANAYHGLRRTNADKRRAVLMLLQDGNGHATVTTILPNYVLFPPIWSIVYVSHLTNR
jgi:hypothetical protein